jgi:urease accessory protein
MRKTLSLPLGLGLLALAGAAAAHPGHGAAGDGGTAIWAGLTHPLGLDHLLAMVAVGLWSALVLPAGRRLHGPAAFLVAMVTGAVAGRALGAPALVEPALALSVLAFAALIAAPRLLPLQGGLVVVALGGLLHGLAHGAELPAAAGFTGYAFGFVATSALLHAAGLALGAQLVRLPQRLAGWSTRAVAGGLGAAALVVLAQA